MTQRRTENVDERVAGAFAERTFVATTQAFELLAMYLGDRLGLYRALAEHGPMTPGELAERAGIHERYAREWLEQQAVAGVLEAAGDGADDRRFTLPASHAAAVTDPSSPFSSTPLARQLVATAQALPWLLDAFRTGGGVQWSAYGPDMIEAQGDFNRPWLLASFGTEHLPSIAGVHERLLADPPARVADVACGLGWAAIAVARAYPKVTVDGFDPDPSSIEAARRLAEEAGVGDRVRFEVRDGAAVGTEGPYDLAVVIEAIHDVARPVEILGAIRESLAPDGSLIVADERVAESFTAPGDEIERFMYGVSVTICLPAAMSEQPTAATGTVIRPDTMREYAERAGFGSVEDLPIEHDFLRFYRMRR